MLAALKDVLKKGTTVPGFNVFGYEDAVSVIRAAEELGRPVILMTNKNAIDFMPIGVFGAMLGKMAENASVPVCIHLDHSRDMEDIRRAAESGYTSVMYDGSQLPLAENIAKTKEVVALAHARGISVEAEIGAVGYADPAMNVKAVCTDPDEAVLFAGETGVDALAVAVGTVHRMVTQEAKIDFELFGRIHEMTDVPLVIHGASGAADEDIIRLCRAGAAKINFGTALRLAFGNTLRDVINENKEEFDRLKLFPAPMNAVREKALEKMRLTAEG